MSGAVDRGKKFIEIESQGLDLLKDSLGQSFDQTVDIFLNASGRIIVTGMGKSGHIARKIAATLASTGSPAIFVHPAEASHGDLGMISHDDAVLALSNSGETQELSDIITYCTRFKIPLIAITQNEKSTLAKRSTVCLSMPKAPEACPNRLAPTTSSTMMLVLGDAIAMCLLEAKGFSASDFKTFHPGGKLGQQLIQVSDIIDQDRSLPLVKEHASYKELINLITAGKVGCVGILTSSGKLKGVVTDGDVRRHALHIKEERALDKLMNTSPKTIPKSALAAEAVRMMKEYQITNVIVVDGDGHPVGIVHIHDCLKAGIF